MARVTTRHLTCLLLRRGTVWEFCERSKKDEQQEGWRILSVLTKITEDDKYKFKVYHDIYHALMDSCSCHIPADKNLPEWEDLVRYIDIFCEKPFSYLWTVLLWFYLSINWYALRNHNLLGWQIVTFQYSWNKFLKCITLTRNKFCQLLLIISWVL